MVQRKRKLNREKRRIVQERTSKLLVTGFSKEIKYTTWISNIVLVDKKTKGTWHMYVYVDFTDLNRVCPKDSYPLPNIDKLVDAAARYEYLSFMDA